MGFVIGLFLGLALGVFLQPAVVMLIARRAHDAASKALDVDDDMRRIVVPPTPPPHDPARVETHSSDGGR
jgi:hypothetical protein